MAEAEPSFEYTAFDATGKRLRGKLLAPSEHAAFERLRRQGLSPTHIRPAQAGRQTPFAPALSDRESAELLNSLADLLAAGADIRAALAVLGDRSDNGPVRRVCRQLAEQISGGEALDVVFARNLATRHAFVAALIAGGEAVGDLPAALRRSGQMLEAGLKLRDQLVGALAYPAFVLVSTLAAMAVLMLFVIPTLEPLVEEGAGANSILSVLFGASLFLRQNGPLLGGLAAGLGLFGLVAGRIGLLADMIDRLLLWGPARRSAAALVFGGFSIALGGMLAAGTPMSDALRLATRGVRSQAGRRRLEPVAHAVRQGQALSVALQQVPGFPPSIRRLVAVGEASGALGAMLSRGGELEEAAAIRRIELASRLLGPALIVVMGGLIGLMMAGVLSGVTELGQAALK